MTPYTDQFAPMSAGEVLALYAETPSGELTISERVFLLEHAFFKAKLEHIVFSQCAFEGTSLEQANLNFGKLLHSCHISDCRLSGATLLNVETERLTINASSMEGTLVQSAFLNNIVLENIQGQGVDFTLSQMIEAYASHSHFKGGHFVEVEAPFSTFTYCNFTDADLSEGNFGGAEFDHCTLDGADLAWTNLMDASFPESTLYGANLYGATLRGATLTREQLVSSGSLGSIRNACETAFYYLGLGTCRKLREWLLVKSDEPLLLYLGLPENDENLELQKRCSAARNFICGAIQGSEENETWVGTPISLIVGEWLEGFLSSF